MKIAHVLLCSAAVPNKNNSITVHDLGLYDLIQIKAVPVRVPHFTVAIGLKTEKGDAGKDHDVYLSILSPSGQPMQDKLLFKISTVPSPMFSPGTVMWAPLALDGARFPWEGSYEFRVELDGKSQSAFVVVAVVPDK